MKSLTEAEILHTKNDNLEKAFIDLFDLYAEEVYQFCFSLLFYHEHMAEEDTRYVFEKAHKFFHAFLPGQLSYRSYLFSLAVTQIQRERKHIVTQSHGLPQSLRRKFSKADYHTWEALQHFDTNTVCILELWYGPGLLINEISVVVQMDIQTVQHIHDSALQHLSTVIPNIQQAIAHLFKQRQKKIVLPKSKRIRLQREVIEGRRPAPTFVKRVWWQALLGPMPLGFVLGIILVVGASVWYVYRPEPLTQADPVDTVVTLDPTVQKRPQVVYASGSLPDVQLSKRSVSIPDATLYGTSYKPEDTTVLIPEEEKLQPKITVDLSSGDYESISKAYVYSVPQALEEDDLQQAAYRHFFSLPLNQFTYVNGTYYIEDKGEEFKPLFIAFNNDGSVEFQMRQAAICQLDGLTKTYTDDETRTTAYDFLRAHYFVEVEEKELKIIRTSEDNRTIKKDSICKDGSSDPVQDREFAFFPNHVTVRYGETGQETLPMRLRGITVQTHANGVTNMRIDRLEALREHMVRSTEADLISLDQAVEEVKKFYYPATAERDQYQRFVKSFAQWDHLHGDARLQEMHITSVDLEYVFDPLNYRIEPYYVFTGTGASTAGPDEEIRIYVVATTEDIELRGPYRE